MERVVIFGAGQYGKYYIEFASNKMANSIELVAAIDNDQSKWNGYIQYNNISILVLRPDQLKKLQFDCIIIANRDYKEVQEIKDQITVIMGDERERKFKVIALIEEQKLFTEVFSFVNIYNEDTDRRVLWLKEYAAFASELRGECAECGVFRGDFAFYINKYFPARMLYLFDTFEGFSSDDIAREQKLGNKAFLEGRFNQERYFCETNESIVKTKMPHIEKCILKKGIFPESANGLNNTEFLFVSLDMDLFWPTYCALDFFYNKMVEGGVILIHDYFKDQTPGIREAVVQFESCYTKMCKVPIGDGCSIAVIK